MSTFRHRLTAALAGLSAAFLSIFCAVLFIWCKAAFLADLDGDLKAIFRADFAAASERGASRTADIPDNSEESHVFNMLLEADGTVISPRDPAAAPNLIWSAESLESVLKHGGVFSDVPFRGTRYRTLSNPVQVGRRTMIEVLGISQEPMQESLEELGRVLLLSLLIGIVLVALVSYRVAAYLTSPLEHILEQLESVTSRGDSALRLNGSYQDSEMVSLRNQVNAMLERLEASFQAQRQFISNASHELRAPLANLTLALDVCLRRPREAEEYRDTLVTCLGETRRLTEMSNQLLQLSKADEGALDVRANTSELYQLVERSVVRKRVAAQAKDVTLELVGAELSLTLDQLMISQVVDNLLDNAIRYSPSGSRVLVAVQDRDGNAEVSVSDAGPGMTSEQLEHVFDRFYRADPSRHRDTGGAGLGLAISQAIAQAHGGALSAESRPSEGTAFTLRLPMEGGAS